MVTKPKKRAIVCDMSHRIADFAARGNEMNMFMRPFFKSSKTPTTTIHVTHYLEITKAADVSNEKLVRYSIFKWRSQFVFDSRYSNVEVSSIFEIRDSIEEVSSIFTAAVDHLIRV